MSKNTIAFGRYVPGDDPLRRFGSPQNEQTISAYISNDTVRRLHQVAEETGKTMDFHMEKALIHYLEEYRDLQIALDRLKDSNDRVISFEERQNKV